MLSDRAFCYLTDFRSFVDFLYIHIIYISHTIHTFCLSFFELSDFQSFVDFRKIPLSRALSLLRVLSLFLGVCACVSQLDLSVDVDDDFLFLSSLYSSCALMSMTTFKTMASLCWVLRASRSACAG